MGITHIEGDNRYVENIANWVREEYGDQAVGWEEVTMGEEDDPDSSVLYIALKNPIPPGSLIQSEHIRAVVVLHRGGKEIPEEGGPVASTCPAKLLMLLSPTDNTEALKWRERCWRNAWNSVYVPEATSPQGKWKMRVRLYFLLDEFTDHEIVLSPFSADEDIYERAILRAIDEIPQQPEQPMQRAEVISCEWISM